MGQMANLLIERQPGALPSNSEINPRRDGNEHVKAVMLRSGKELETQAQPLVIEEVETEKVIQPNHNDDAVKEQPNEKQSVGRGGKIGPTRWASSVLPKLGPGWAIKLLAQKKPGEIWPGPVWPSPVWPGQARPARIFFALKRLFGPTGPVFRAGWAVKILARKNRANFGPARFWPSPLLAWPSPARPA